MKKSAFILVAILTLFACNEVTTEEFDVRFSVPESISIERENPYITFRIQFGKAPVETDVIYLESGSGNHSCPITEITSSNFTVSVPSTIIGDTYTVYIQRGEQKLEKGETVISVEDGITPDETSTVYGQVTCDGVGVEGVLISDGVEIVQTDADGVYQLNSAKKYGYVFMTIPEGYEALLDGVIPTFYKKLTTTTVAQRHDFALQKADNTNYTLYVLGDMHLANRGHSGGSNKDVQQFRQFASDLNATLDATAGYEYVVTLGDMTWDLYWYQVSLGQFDLSKYVELVNSLFSDIAFFHTMGNHDNDYKGLADFGKEAPYRDIVAPTYYSFNIGKIHYIVLDNIDYLNVAAGTCDASGVMQDPDVRDGYKVQLIDDQLEWIAKDLSYVDKSTPVIVACHGPFTRPNSSTSFSNNMTNTSTVQSLFSGYNWHVFSGHTHKAFNNDKMSSTGFFEHNAGSVCGSWWWSGSRTDGINIAQDGTPGGYTILSVNGTDLKWQYKSTGHDLDYQFRAYDMNKVKEYVAAVEPTSNANATTFANLQDKIAAFGTNEILLNVWNYDPSWTVTISENGSNLTVSSLNTYDPLHIVAMSAKHSNFSTDSWCHFFKATASSADSTVEIKITDRFGNTYSETMTRPKAFEISD